MGLCRGNSSSQKKKNEYIPGCSLFTALVVGTFAIMIGAILVGVSIPWAVNYNSQFSKTPYQFIIVGHRVEERICEKTTCFPALIIADIPEANMTNYELLMFLNGFQSSIYKPDKNTT